MKNSTFGFICIFFGWLMKYSGRGSMFSWYLIGLGIVSASWDFIGWILPDSDETVVRRSLDAQKELRSEINKELDPLIVEIKGSTGKGISIAGIEAIKCPNCSGPASFGDRTIIDCKYCGRELHLKRRHD